MHNRISYGFEFMHKVTRHLRPACSFVGPLVCGSEIFRELALSMWAAQRLLYFYSNQLYVRIYF